MRYMRKPIYSVFVPMFEECSFTRVQAEGRTNVCALQVFVPMFGECSFIGGQSYDEQKNCYCFRPHVWGMFFHWLHVLTDIQSLWKRFSSPCLGNVLSFHIVDDCAPLVFVSGEFSSPCLGNVLSYVQEHGTI